MTPTHPTMDDPNINRRRAAQLLRANLTGSDSDVSELLDAAWSDGQEVALVGIIAELVSGMSEQLIINAGSVESAIKTCDMVLLDLALGGDDD